MIRMLAGTLPRTPDNPKSPNVSDCRNEGKKNPPAINRGTFIPFSLSTFGVAPASPFATEKIIRFRIPEVKRRLGGFAFISAGAKRRTDAFRAAWRKDE